MAATSFSYSTYLLIFVTIVQGIVMPHPAVAINILYSGDNLYYGQSLVEGNYAFTMQSDCNLVLYDAGRAVWASGSAGWSSNCRLAMQSDGNLVVYTTNGVTLWATNTARSSGHYVLIMQLDRNVVIYGGAIWSTGTRVSGAPNVDIKTKNTTKLP